MKRVVLVIVAMIAMAVVGAWLDWRLEHKNKQAAGTAARGPHISTAAEIQGGPLTPQRKRMFAALACGRSVETNDNGEISCPVCPAGSDFGAPETQSSEAPGIVPADLPGSGWTYGSMMFGHFTAPDAEEALLKTNGCESHANNMGGDVLLRKSAGKWTKVRYLQGGLVDEGCQRLRWDGGRDALVCHTGDMHQGIASDTAMLVTVEPTPPKPDQDGKGTWFLMVSDDEGDCTSDQEPRMTQSASIDRINLLPGANGRQDLELLASIGRVKAKVVNDQCPAAEKKSYRLRFRNDGDHFTAVEGLQEITGLKADDCCEVATTEEVRPFRF